MIFLKFTFLFINMFFLIPNCQYRKFKYSNIPCLEIISVEFSEQLIFTDKQKAVGERRKESTSRPTMRTLHFFCICNES